LKKQYGASKLCEDIEIEAQYTARLELDHGESEKGLLCTTDFVFVYVVCV
jgi:hypothetical protein